MTDPTHAETCGLCEATVARDDVVRGATIAVCRGCVRRGLDATLGATDPRAVETTVAAGYVLCSVCEQATPPSALCVPSEVTGRSMCVTCLKQSFEVLTKTLEVGIYRQIHFRPKEDPLVKALLEPHFGELSLESVVTSSRLFRTFTRVDLQRALDRRFAGSRCVGLHLPGHRDSITFAHALVEGGRGIRVAPLELEEVDVAGESPARCLRTGLWLVEGDVPFVVILSFVMLPPRGWRVEVCVPPGDAGLAVVDELFQDLEASVRASAPYRGRVLSFEQADRRGGMYGAGLTVHRLSRVAREEIILPAATLELLERNVFRFVEQRARLAEQGLPSKKGLLFYGPPGTGKTHTIRHLAGALADHTTLLVTAGEVAHIDEYMSLARLLSPSIVVIEDVDLIAREREAMRHPGEESLLNRLLNEMDGLKEDAEILFILTTNRAEALEGALTGRPGRIDQAVEFPLPDDAGRAKLVELYRRRLRVPDAVAAEIVRRTTKSSAAFIKELMRRVGQFAVERDPETDTATHEDVDLALEEMLFRGGSLNAKLLGGEGARIGFE